MANHNVSNIGELLVQEGIISESDYREARREQLRSGRSLSQVLIDNKLITEAAKTALLRKRLGIQVCDASNLQLTELVLQQIPAGFARSKRCVPVSIDGGQLLVAMEDPCDWETIENIKTMTGMNVKTCIATAALIQSALDAYPEQPPIPAVIRPERRVNVYKIVKYVSLAVGLLIPVLVGGFLLFFSESFQKKLIEALLKQEMSFFDLFIYLTLGLTIWSVIIFYIHGTIFPERRSRPQPEE
ncbi:MAG: hypothetical protein Kow0059_07940 [Candidatus Sumerlaeia bacterium]